MASGNRTLAEETELDAGLIKAVLSLGTGMFVIFILGVALLFSLSEARRRSVAGRPVGGRSVARRLGAAPRFRSADPPAEPQARAGHHPERQKREKRRRRHERPAVLVARVEAHGTRVRELRKRSRQR
jgi:hypothetical protein